jgi:thymidylate synthase
MLLIEGLNVNITFDKAVQFMNVHGVNTSSRNGDVTAPNCPVMTVTQKPTERVLFNKYRNANPFFHFFECLWMLSGSSDGRYLDTYVSDFSSRFGEPGGNLWGAYGHRWINHFNENQLYVAIDALKKNPEDRRVVIAMWDPNVDIYSEELTSTMVPARDLPCNTHMYPRIVNGALDLSIMCRSNDVVWGCYGANAVHFSFVQEYLAGLIGVPVGKMYQFSNNWHLYHSTAHLFKRDEDIPNYPGTFPIVAVPDMWDEDLFTFMHMPEDSAGGSNPFFEKVALPMYLAHLAWKAKDHESMAYHAANIAAPDWRLAVLEWMRRRADKW